MIKYFYDRGVYVSLNINPSIDLIVDQYGKVTNAIPGAAGTTVQDKQLWEAAKKAAYQAVFNISSDAPTVQEGTITYIFKFFFI